MLTWSTSTIPAIRFSKNQSKEAEEFLESWNSAIYEDGKIKDAELSKEASLWRSKFVHLRIVGKECVGGSEKPKTIIENLSQKLKISKSAYTMRDKSREVSLPRIEKKKGKQ